MADTSLPSFLPNIVQVLILTACIPEPCNAGILGDKVPAMQVDRTISPSAGALITQMEKTWRGASLGWENQEFNHGLV